MIDRSLPVIFMPAQKLPLAVDRMHLDQCMPKNLARMLRSHGLDVTTAADSGLIHARDCTHLQFAERQGRLLITRDRGFCKFHRNGTQHAGMLICRQETPNEEILRFIQDLPSLASGAAQVASPSAEPPGSQRLIAIASPRSICGGYHGEQAGDKSTNGQSCRILFLPAQKVPLATNRVYLAQCMPKTLAKLLRGYGLNVTTTADAKMNGAKAHAHLNLTRYQRRLLITRNRRFVWYHKQGDPHPGMLVCLEEATNDEILRFIQNSLASGGGPCEIEAQQE